MRTSNNQEIGDIGEGRVRQAFIELRWGIPLKPLSDVGDDLLTFARDEHAGDLGLPVMAQVKTSETEYSTPERGPDGATGWWYYESDTEHFDHWVRYGLPYLLILHDFNSSTSYWVHVTGEAIDATGKGRKIFVPQAQTLDAEHKKDLIAVASQPRFNPLEGSAWDGHAAHLGESSRLRTALISPRLIAPHPNRERKKLRFEQAAAMVVRGRGADLSEYAREDLCPSATEMAAHADWGWRFVAALINVVARDRCDTTMLRPLVASARHPFEAVACVVLGACAQVYGPTPSAALRWLDSVGCPSSDTAATSSAASADIDVTSPHAGSQTARSPSAMASEESLPARGSVQVSPGPDWAWVLVHRAHLLAELGKRTEAAAAVKQALLALQHRESDATVTALRGSCAALMLNLTFTSEALRAAVTGHDSAVSWWRSQQLAATLSRGVNQAFLSWSESTKVQYLVVPPTAAIGYQRWTAALAADWADWRRLSGVAGRTLLMDGVGRGTDPGDVRATVERALTMLCAAGDRDAVRDSVLLLWRLGHFEALRQTVETLTAGEWLMRREGCILAMIAHCGDLLGDEAADQVTTRVTALIDAGPARRFGGATQWRWPEVCQSFRGLAAAASVEGQAELLDWVVGQLTRADTVETGIDVTVSDEAGQPVEERDLSVDAKLIDVVVEVVAVRDPDLHDRWGRGGGWRRLVDIAVDDQSPIGPAERTRLLEVVATVDEHAQLLIRQRAGSDVESALAALRHGFGGVAEWGVVADRARSRVRELVRDADSESGTSRISQDGHVWLRHLSVSALQRADTDDWHLVCDALLSGVLLRHQVESTLGFVAMHYPSVPEPVQARLREVLTMPPLRQSPFDRVDLAPVLGMLEVVSGALRDDEVLARVLALSDAGLDKETCELLTLWGSPLAAAMLAGRCASPDPGVRASAAFFLAKMVSAGQAEVAMATAAHVVALGPHSEGAVAQALASALEEYGAILGAGVAARLSDHASGRIRRRALLAAR